MPRFVEMDERTPVFSQMDEQGGPVVLIKRAFGDPEFQAKLGQYPPSAVASPHLFRKVAVPGICVA